MHDHVVNYRLLDIEIILRLYRYADIFQPLVNFPRGKVTWYIFDRENRRSYPFLVKILARKGCKGLFQPLAAVNKKHLPPKVYKAVRCRSSGKIDKSLALAGAPIEHFSPFAAAFKPE